MPSDERTPDPKGESKLKEASSSELDAPFGELTIRDILIAHASFAGVITDPSITDLYEKKAKALITKQCMEIIGEDDPIPTERNLGRELRRANNELRAEQRNRLAERKQSK